MKTKVAFRQYRINIPKFTIMVQSHKRTSSEDTHRSLSVCPLDSNQWVIASPVPLQHKYSNLQKFYFWGIGDKTNGRSVQSLQCESGTGKNCTFPSSSRNLLQDLIRIRDGCKVGKWRFSFCLWLVGSPEPQTSHLWKRFVS